MSESGLKYSYNSSASCCECGEPYSKLNQFGYCAKCFSLLPRERIEAIYGIKVVPEIIREVVEERTTHVHIPHPRILMVGVVSVVCGLSGGVCAWLIMRWLVHP